MMGDTYVTYYLVTRQYDTDPKEYLCTDIAELSYDWSSTREHGHQIFSFGVAMAAMRACAKGDMSGFRFDVEAVRVPS